MNAQKQSWLTHRQSGVLAHISSLPGAFGIGNIGAASARFVDFLADCGFHYWQICPAGPTGYGDSPYQSFSSHAGNPYFIDLSKLVACGLLTEAEVEPLRALSTESADYGGLYGLFEEILGRACERFDPQMGIPGFSLSWEDFVRQNNSWLKPYALFMGLKKLHAGKAWHQWAPGFRNFAEINPRSLPAEVLQEQQRHMVFQYLFFNQWKVLRDYAHSKGIQIIGDVPIFVAHDSADVWQHPEVFRIRKDGSLIVSAGVPPDYFSESGQYWGNPLYDWHYLRQTGYLWWLDRLEGAFALYDVVRLDHFRAFSSYWEIPGGAPDAKSGQWLKGPGMDFFNAVFSRFPELRIIAEDLGYIDQDVYDLRLQSGLPGMKVLQFGFGHDTNNVNLPHFYRRNSVVYTGTHDNDTTFGWLRKLDDHTSAQINDYFGAGESCNVRTLIRAAFLSVSYLAVIPMQDLLGLDSAARMNTPGTSQGNWQWRFTQQQLDAIRDEAVAYFQRLHRISDRCENGSQHEFSASP
ncbi:MAG: 4-alpha-glucanotransferase [Opitutales bacterium]|nr:4-alpha-glucanotransferase [Opitutales bacterium]